MRMLRWVMVAVAAAAATLVAAEPAAAVPGITVVQASVPADSWGKKMVNPKCPQNTVPLGGGAEIDDGGAGVRLLSSGSTETGWIAWAHEVVEGYNGSWSMRGWAICAPQPPGYQRVNSELEEGSEFSAAASVHCTGGRKVLGIGGASVFGSGRATLDTIKPTPDLTGVKVEVFAGPGEVTEPLAARASAVCADPGLGLQMVSLSTPTSSSSYKTISVGCPPGTDAHGVSASLSGAMGGAHLDAMSVFSIGVYAEARENSTGYRGSWKLDVLAICAM
jgi:hypothetical protein